MNPSPQPDPSLEARLASPLLEVLIRAGLILALALLCYQIFSPFLPLMVWAVILAVTLYPLHQTLANQLGGRQGLAATLLVTLGLVLIVAPTVVLMNSLGDSVHHLIHDAQNHSLTIPAPRPGVEAWPVVGKKLYDLWSKAATDLPALVQSLQPKLGELVKTALGLVARIGGELVQFLAAFIIAGILMAFGQSGELGRRAIAERLVGTARGGDVVRLSTATIRAVAQGVIGVAFLQALIVGLALLVVGIPGAGALAMVMLVLGIAQVPALIVTLPAIGYLWSSADYSNAAAITYTVVLFLAGRADNVLKPLLLGRGVEVPMPVILLGALGGMATAGLLGLFVGATLLALGYELFMGWVAAPADTTQASSKSDAPPAISRVGPPGGDTG